jgi:hypothetical protein
VKNILPATRRLQHRQPRHGQCTSSSVKKVFDEKNSATLPRSKRRAVEKLGNRTAANDGKSDGALLLFHA